MRSDVTAPLDVDRWHLDFMKGLTHRKRVKGRVRRWVERVEYSGIVDARIVVDASSVQGSSSRTIAGSASDWLR